MFVSLITKCTVFEVKIFFKAPVGRRQAKLPVLDRDITGHFIEKLLVALLAAVQFFPQTFDFGNIRRYLHNQFDSSVLIANRRGMDNDRSLKAIGCFYGRLDALGTVKEIIAQSNAKTLEEAFISITGGVEERELLAWREQKGGKP